MMDDSLDEYGPTPDASITRKPKSQQGQELKTNLAGSVKRFFSPTHYEEVREDTSKAASSSNEPYQPTDPFSIYQPYQGGPSLNSKR